MILYSKKENKCPHFAIMYGYYYALNTWLQINVKQTTDKIIKGNLNQKQRILENEQKKKKKEKKKIKEKKKRKKKKKKKKEINKIEKETWRKKM